MKNIRIGKDIVLKWVILTNGQSLPLKGRNLTLQLHLPTGKFIAMPFEIEDTNTLVFRYPGMNHTNLGTYSLTLWENFGKAGQTVVDKTYAFNLVRNTDAEGGSTMGLVDVEQTDLESGDLEVGNMALIQGDAVKVDGAVIIIDAYPKSETYTQTEVDTKFSNAKEEIDAALKDIDEQLNAHKVVQELGNNTANVISQSGITSALESSKVFNVSKSVSGFTLVGDLGSSSAELTINNATVDGTTLKNDQADGYGTQTITLKPASGESLDGKVLVYDGVAGGDHVAYFDIQNNGTILESYNKNELGVDSLTDINIGTSTTLQGSSVQITIKGWGSAFKANFAATFDHFFICDPIDDYTQEDYINQYDGALAYQLSPKYKVIEVVKEESWESVYTQDELLTLMAAGTNIFTFNGSPVRLVGSTDEGVIAHVVDTDSNSFEYYTLTADRFLPDKLLWTILESKWIVTEERLMNDYIVQELGENDNRIVSQRVVSEAISELDDKIKEVEEKDSNDALVVSKAEYNAITKVDTALYFIKNQTNTFTWEGGDSLTYQLTVDGTLTQLTTTSKTVELPEGLTRINNMFAGCSSLTSVDVSDIDTSEVTSFMTTFGNCTSLKELDLSSWVIKSGAKFPMFLISCTSLETLDVSNWDITSFNTTMYVFLSCNSLTKVIVKNCPDTTKQLFIDKLADDMVGTFVESDGVLIKTT